MYDNAHVNGNELLKKLRIIAKKRGLPIKLVKSHGKGSHMTLDFGGQKATMKDLKKEIGPGLLSAMLDRIGLTKNDIE